MQKGCVPDPSSLRHCKERGPGTAPYCWYLQISGEPTWDQEYTSFKKMKDMWDGWTGKNERRAQARRESAQQQETDRQGHRDSYRDAAAASRDWRARAGTNTGEKNLNKTTLSQQTSLTRLRAELCLQHDHVGCSCLDFIGSRTLSSRTLS